MGGAGDARILQQQQAQQQQQAAAQNAQLYNPDGSGKANDYHPPPLPASGFPQLAGGHEIQVHPDRLTQVATQMGAELNRLEASVMEIYSNGYGGAEITGWSTAEAFSANAASAYDGISQFHADLNLAYQQVIGNLRMTVVNYADAESASSSAARTVGSDTTLPGGLSSA